MQVRITVNTIQFFYNFLLIHEFLWHQCGLITCCCRTLQTLSDSQFQWTCQTLVGCTSQHHSRRSHCGTHATATDTFSAGDCFCRHTPRSHGFQKANLYRLLEHVFTSFGAIPSNQHNTLLRDIVPCLQNTVTMQLQCPSIVGLC